MFVNVILRRVYDHAHDGAISWQGGCQLIAAALYVIRESDGLHRLSQAVAEWALAVANEGDRARWHHQLSEEEQVEDQRRFVDWLKSRGIYNAHASSTSMLHMYRVWKECRAEQADRSQVEVEADS